MRAIGSVRVSTDEQAHSGLGKEAQAKAIEDWCRREGLTLDFIAVDDGVCSVAELEKRDGMTAALAELGPGDVLVVAKRDRLARDPLLTAFFELEAKKRGAKVVSAAGEGTESDDPASMLMRRIVDAFAEYERAMIRHRTRNALAAKKRRGEWVGQAPCGWKPEGGKLVREQGEMRAIEMMVAARKAGLSYARIAARLTEAGFPRRAKKKPKPWNASTVRMITQRELAKLKPINET